MYSAAWICAFFSLHQVLSFASSTFLRRRYHNSPYQESDLNLCFRFQLDMDTWGCRSLKGSDHQLPLTNTCNSIHGDLKLMRTTEILG